MMGIVPLQFLDGESRETLGLSGRERYSIAGLADRRAEKATVTTIPDDGGEPIVFQARVRLDTPREREYVRNGGILPFVLRRLLAQG